MKGVISVLSKVANLTGSPRSWLQDDMLRRLFKNAALLFSGSMVASGLGLVSLALTARALGADRLGVLVLIVTYVLIIDRLVNFQSWQAIIKFGADALQEKRSDDFKALIRFGFLLDISAAVLGAAVAGCGAWFIGQWLRWGEEVVWMATLYSLTILFHVSGTSMGVLRLFNRFHVVATQSVIAASIKLIGVFAAFWFEAGLWTLLVVWAITDIVGNAMLVVFAVRELDRQSMIPRVRSTGAPVSSRFPGIWSFALTSNANVALRSAIRETDVLVIGAVLGPTGAGLFRIVKSFASVLGKIADPLYVSIYPEMARLISSGRLREFRSYAIRASALSGAAGLALFGAAFVIAYPILHFSFGLEYVAAYWPLVVYMLAYVVWFFFYPLSGAVLAFGKPTANLVFLLISSTFYYPLLIVLMEGYGLVGASIACVVFYLAWSVMMMFVVIKEYNLRASAQILSQRPNPSESSLIQGSSNVTH